MIFRTGEEKFKFSRDTTWNVTQSSTSKKTVVDSVIVSFLQKGCQWSHSANILVVNDTDLQ